MNTIEILHIFHCGEDAIPDQKMTIGVYENMKPSIQNNVLWKLYNIKVPKLAYQIEGGV